MDIKTPEQWRKGQTIFNFLEWLRVKKGKDTSQSYRLADTYYINDKEFDALYKEFLEEHL